MDETQVTPGVSTDDTQVDPQVEMPAPEVTEGEVVVDTPAESPTDETAI